MKPIGIDYNLIVFLYFSAVSVVYKRKQIHKFIREQVVTYML